MKRPEQAKKKDTQEKIKEIDSCQVNTLNKSMSGKICAIVRGKITGKRRVTKKNIVIKNNRRQQGKIRKGVGKRSVTSGRPNQGQPK